MLRQRGAHVKSELRSEDRIRNQNVCGSVTRLRDCWKHANFENLAIELFLVRKFENFSIYKFEMTNTICNGYLMDTSVEGLIPIIPMLFEAG